MSPTVPPRGGQAQGVPGGVQQAVTRDPGEPGGQERPKLGPNYFSSTSAEISGHHHPNQLTNLHAGSLVSYAGSLPLNDKIASFLSDNSVHPMLVLAKGTPFLAHCDSIAKKMKASSDKSVRRCFEALDATQELLRMEIEENYASMEPAAASRWLRSRLEGYRRQLRGLQHTAASTLFRETFVPDFERGPPPSSIGGKLCRPPCTHRFGATTGEYHVWLHTTSADATQMSEHEVNVAAQTRSLAEMRA